MQNTDVKYSIVVPVFNSAVILEELFAEIDSVFRDMKENYEVVFVDDGSSDKSWDVIEKIKMQHPEILVAIRLTKNFGQHNATFCGLNFASGRFIITIDDDLQVPPAEIKLLIEKYQEQNPDLVYGIFPVKKHSLLRNLGSAAIKKSTRIFAGAPGEGSSFRLMSRELVEKMVSHHQNAVYIDELVLWYTGNIAFVNVDHHKPRIKKKGYSFIKLTGLYFKIIFFSTDIPLKIITYGGWTVSMITFMLGLRFIFRKIFFRVPLGYTSIIVSIFFSTSLILISLGIIGEYLRRVYEGQNKKMPYLIKKVLK